MLNQFTSIQRVCGTCERWCGSRNLHISRMFCESELNNSGRCPIRQRDTNVREICSDYRKWSNLK